MKRWVSVLLITILLLSSCGKEDNKMSIANSTQHENEKVEATEKKENVDTNQDFENDEKKKSMRRYQQMQKQQNGNI